MSGRRGGAIWAEEWHNLTSVKRVWFCLQLGSQYCRKYSREERDNCLDLWIGSPDNLSSKLGYLTVKGGPINNYIETAVMNHKCTGKMWGQGHASLRRKKAGQGEASLECG